MEKTLVCFCQACNKYVDIGQQHHVALPLSSNVLCVIHLRATSQVEPMNLIRNMCSDKTLLKLLPHFPKVSELTNLPPSAAYMRSLWGFPSMGFRSPDKTLCVADSLRKGECYNSMLPSTQALKIHMSCENLKSAISSG